MVQRLIRQQGMMTTKTRLILFGTIFFWASAFVGIREGLECYSPGGLALLRYFIASLCIFIFYIKLPNKAKMPFVDACKLLGVGAIGVGVYAYTLNSGEVAISSGSASFIISQSPLIAALLSVFVLGEQLSLGRLLGFIISIIGVALISFGEKDGFKWDASLTYICIATLSSGFYSVAQKPFLKKYHPIVVASYLIWGGALFLLLYTKPLMHDLGHATTRLTLMVVYLGVFPAAVSAVGWSYVLAVMPASRAVSYLYFMPFIAMFLGMIWLGEKPHLLAILGGMCAILGVGVVNQSIILSKYKYKKLPL